MIGRDADDVGSAMSWAFNQAESRAVPGEALETALRGRVRALEEDLDLRKHGLVENGGKISGGDTLRNVTPMGLKAASYEPGRPVREIGGPARGPGRSGASHPMAVNDALFALLRTEGQQTRAWQRMR